MKNPFKRKTPMNQSGQAILQIFTVGIALLLVLVIFMQFHESLDSTFNDAIWNMGQATTIRLFWDLIPFVAAGLGALFLLRALSHPATPPV